MKKINIENLQVGDIVLTTSPEKTSSIIKKFTSSDISHAMICVARGSVIDSTDEGVQARNVQKMFYPDSCAIYILRVKESLSDIVLTQIIDYVRSRVGTPYTVTEAMAAITKTGRGSSKQFCSRLVARAFSEAGVALVKNADYCTPEDIKKSSLLFQVENASIQVNQAEIDTIKKNEDQTIKMREATNNLLEKAKEISHGIENINNITEVAIKSPEKDKALAEALKNSGYLDVWKTEVDLYSWRYDIIEFVRLYHSLPPDGKKELIEYCNETISDDTRGTFKHWEVSLQSFQNLSASLERETINLFKELYINLCTNHSKRIMVAKTMVQTYGHDNF